MNILNFSVIINATPSEVWSIMLGRETYSLWSDSFSPRSQFKGEWKQGSHIYFFDPDLGGSKAYLEDLVEDNHVLIRHVAFTDKNLVEDTSSEAAQKWIGNTELYKFTPVDGRTLLGIKIETHEAFVGILHKGWGEAIGKLKGLVEKTVASKN